MHINVETIIARRHNRFTYACAVERDASMFSKGKCTEKNLCRPTTFSLKDHGAIQESSYVLKTNKITKHLHKFY